MSEKSEKTPKVFISYAWANQKFVIELAERLMRDGVDTIIDVWYLKQGNEKYAFMESMVRDETIDHVLIICDKIYKEKADNRTGGVGDETVIISPKLYEEMEQTKFVPIVLENDEDGNPCKPIYISSRIHFDFSNKENYEEEYESLLRFLYDEPYYPKPKIGKKPEWLKKDAVSISEINHFVDVLKSSSNETRKNATIDEFIQTFISKTKEFKVTTNPRDGLEKFCTETEAKVNEMKPLRNSYLDFLKELILSEKDVPEFFCTLIESLFNDLLLLRINGNSYTNYDQAMLELYRIFIWNIFVSTIAYLLHYKKFSEIHEILTHIFVLIDDGQTLEYKNPKTFLEFRCYCEMFDGFYSNNFYGNKDRFFSKTADIVINQIKEPILTKENFVQTDIILSQLSFALQISKLVKNTRDPGWFPLSYVYSKNPITLWTKLLSKKYCQKILPLFGVKTIEELIQTIKEHPVNANYRYNSWYSIPDIPLKFEDHDIASLN